MNTMAKILLAGCVLAAIIHTSSGVDRTKRQAGHYQGNDEEYYNNYYNYNSAPPAQKKSGGPFAWITNLFDNRRSGSSGYSGSSSSGYSSHPPKHPNKKGGFNIADIALPAILLGSGILLGTLAFAALNAALSSSGRGLDSDEWEVNHSVWMDQLERDFEDSWSVEE